MREGNKDTVFVVTGFSALTFVGANVGLWLAGGTTIIYSIIFLAGFLCASIMAGMMWGLREKRHE